MDIEINKVLMALRLEVSPDVANSIQAEVLEYGKRRYRAGVEAMRDALYPYVGKDGRVFGSLIKQEAARLLKEAGEAKGT